MPLIYHSVQTSHPSYQEEETGKSRPAWSTDLESKFQDHQGNPEKLFLKSQNKKPKPKTETETKAKTETKSRKKEKEKRKGEKEKFLLNLRFTITSFPTLLSLQQPSHTLLHPS